MTFHLRRKRSRCLGTSLGMSGVCPTLTRGSFGGEGDFPLVALAETAEHSCHHHSARRLKQCYICMLHCYTSNLILHYSTLSYSNGDD